MPMDPNGGRDASARPNQKAGLKRNHSDNKKAQELEGKKNEREYETFRGINPQNGKKMKKQQGRDAEEKRDGENGKADDVSMGSGDEKKKLTKREMKGFFIGPKQSHREKEFKKKAKKHYDLLSTLMNKRLLEMEVYIEKKMEQLVRRILREPRPVGLPPSLPPSQPASAALSRQNAESPAGSPGEGGVATTVNVEFSKYVEEIAVSRDGMELGNLFFLFNRSDTTHCDREFWRGAELLRPCLKFPNSVDLREGDKQMKLLESYITSAAGKATVDNNNLTSKLYEVIFKGFFSEFGSCLPPTLNLHEAGKDLKGFLKQLSLLSGPGSEYHNEIKGELKALRDIAGNAASVFTNGDEVFSFFVNILHLNMETAHSFVQNAACGQRLSFLKILCGKKTIADFVKVFQKALATGKLYTTVYFKDFAPDGTGGVFGLEAAFAAMFYTKSITGIQVRVQWMPDVRHLTFIIEFLQEAIRDANKTLQRPAPPVLTPEEREKLTVRINKVEEYLGDALFPQRAE